METPQPAPKTPLNLTLVAIVALVLAASAQKEIAAGQGRVQGQGLVTAAKIISWINIGLWGAIVVIGAFFLILALVAGS